MTPFLGSLMSCSWSYASKGFAFCNGQTLSISANQALFSLLGTTFGGDGISTFLLPNLQGMTPISSGQGSGLSNYVLGQPGGQAAHTLSVAEMPAHTHILSANSAAGATPRLGGNSPGVTPAATPIYGLPQNLTPMNSLSVSNTGNSVAHENRQPFLVINWVIALTGIFPSRN